MRVVLSRVHNASVVVNNSSVGSISKGLVLFVGISSDCTYEKLEWMARKIPQLRLWASDKKGFDLSLQDIEGELLVVSNFTLQGVIDGNKPNFRASMEYAKAQELFDLFVEMLRNTNLKVETGEFGAMMDVQMEHDGPVNLVLDR